MLVITAERPMLKKITITKIRGKRYFLINSFVIRMAEILVDRDSFKCIFYGVKDQVTIP